MYERLRDIGAYKRCASAPVRQRKCWFWAERLRYTGIYLKFHDPRQWGNLLSLRTPATIQLQDLWRRQKKAKVGHTIPLIGEAVVMMHLIHGTIGGKYQIIKT